MTISKNEFLVLREVVLHPGCAQRKIAEATGLSLGSVNAAAKTLTAAGLIDEGEATEAGGKALEPYRVENAIILAAGLSSRFAPISYEKPKGLLKVRGEVLIERQIEQLIAAGITDITVVVGYKKEYFFYLEDKFGVSIVVNPDYASRNNSSSIKCVEDRLGNTYICSSDDYFIENPFEPYVWKAYYAVEYAEGETTEWCIQTGAHDRITAVTIGGANAWYMIGHVYFDHAFSRAYVPLLDAVYDNPATIDKLWEHIYLDHIKDLDMVARRYPTGMIFEFDSLDEVREFDPMFLENLDSEVFDNIVAVLGCSKGEIHDVYPLKQGLTNLSCHFATNEGEYVYRHPGIGTEAMIDRTSEKEAQKIAHDLGIDDTFIHEDERGWKISRFIPDARNLDPRNDGEVARAMRVGRMIHESGATVDNTFDFYTESKHYEALLAEHGPIDVPGYREMAEMAQRVKEFADADGAPTCLTHNDFFYLNFLIDEDNHLYLIDWEYSGLADYASDFGTYVVCCECSEQEALRALEHYFGRKPTFEEVRHNFAYVALAGWCWYVWSLVKEAEGDFVGEWLYIYYNYAKKYLGKVLRWYDESFYTEG
ncbi:NTP transferase domain-containing protein [Adlercreutzia muris]|uniref:NTP transferase domain-containing protein n=1 Tax=Adlercreutzia muris TaxID=1796610 RepID=A0A7C8FVV7_9ACTN|nr:NTP transferase domain-containing protein [Adlercreutzia muris]KAB1640043.1 NTP transferase domain-containing protein [Adlercreutzia muris]MCR2029250.1 phosphocholine cytidylyltransferase/choline kinase family protein [Adlercreutzia muris]